MNPEQLLQTIYLGDRGCKAVMIDSYNQRVAIQVDVISDGVLRAASMTAEERSESARNAVKARWARVKRKKVKKTAS